MTLSPKHLSFDEMWKLYKTIKPGIPEKHQEKLVDEVLIVLKNVGHENFISSMQLLFGKNFGKNKTIADFGIMFIQGIKKNKFFLFVDFIEKFTHDHS